MSPETNWLVIQGLFVTYDQTFGAIDRLYPYLWLLDIIGYQHTLRRKSRHEI